jgi:hypothetical protein
MINTLVGISIENSMIDRLDDWIAKPGSPNLYWALTALPQPLVGVREAFEQERLLPENMIPELASLDAPRSPAAWTLQFDSLYNRMNQLARRLFPEDPNAPKEYGQTHGEMMRTLMGVDAAEFKRIHLPACRTLLLDSGRFTEEQMKTMSDDEVAARGVGLGSQILWDESIKATYLPYPEAIKLGAAQDRLHIEAKKGPLALFASLLPALASGRAAEVRLDRRVAMLRVVEAIRMYAAGHDGKLPDSLDAIEEVPIPLDPTTGGPFTLKVDGDVTTLVPPDASLMFLPDYRISIRKPDARAGSAR